MSNPEWYAPLLAVQCGDPSCTELADPTAGGYCLEHKRERERFKRSTSSAAYQRPEYRRARRALLAKYGPTCWTCETSSNPTAHHIDGNPYNNRLTNLAVICQSCHGRLEREIDLTELDGRPIGRIGRRLARVLDARTPAPRPAPVVLEVGQAVTTPDGPGIIKALSVTTPELASVDVHLDAGGWLTLPASSVQPTQGANP